jgi:hypothetical protein
MFATSTGTPQIVLIVLPLKASQGDSLGAHYLDWVRGRYIQIFDVEEIHKDFLEARECYHFRWHRMCLAIQLCIVHLLLSLYVLLGV